MCIRDRVEGIKDFLSNYIFADKDLVETIRKSDVQFFMDSLEIGTSQGDSMFWAHDMAEEFQARKGYDIRPYLPLFIGTTNRWSVEYADAVSYTHLGESRPRTNFIYFPMGHNVRMQTLFSSLIQEYSAADFHHNEKTGSLLMLIFEHLEASKEYSYYGPNRQTAELLQYVRCV